MIGQYGTRYCIVCGFDLVSLGCDDLFGCLWNEEEKRLLWSKNTSEAYCDYSWIIRIFIGLAQHYELIMGLQLKGLGTGCRKIIYIPHQFHLVELEKGYNRLYFTYPLWQSPSLGWLARQHNAYFLIILMLSGIESSIIIPFMFDKLYSRGRLYHSLLRSHTIILKT